MNAVRALPWFLLALAGCRTAAPAEVTATGTLEVAEVDIGPMVPARVVRLFVEEGDSVGLGDTLALLTQATLLPDIASRQARVRGAEAQLRELLEGARPAELRRAEAQVAAATAEAERAARDLERAELLARSGTVSRQSYDAAKASADASNAALREAEESLRLLREGARAERIQAARAEVAAARGAVAVAESTAADLVLTAPVAGVVFERHVEPGEVIGAAQAAITLGQLEAPWTRVYVGERVLPRIRTGQAVVGHLDGMRDRGFPGRVVSIGSKAEFTPRIALTEEERADLVFGVKVRFAQDSAGLLKPGLPITVTFTLAAEPRE
jgi:HlyD family secretion protein